MDDDNRCIAVLSPDSFRLVAVRQLNKFDDWWRTEQSLQRVILVGLHCTLKPPLQAEKGQGPLSRAVKWCFRPKAEVG